jgi:hypothetical protein
MSSIGSGVGGSGAFERIDASAPETTPIAGGAGAAGGTGATARGSTGAREAVHATITGAADLAHEVPGSNAGIRADGAIVPLSAGVGGPLATLNELALRPADAAGPFDTVDDAALLLRVTDRLSETHAGLMGEAPDDATELAWRQSRAAALHLMEQAAVRAHGMGDEHTSRQIVQRLLGAITAEPWKQTRDFAYESIVGRAEGAQLREVEAAREAVYPSTPPYERWLEDGKIDVQLYVDDSGSPLDAQLRFFTRRLGFSHTANPDGTHSLSLAGSGNAPPVEITIARTDQRPSLFETMDDPSVDVIAYTGHAGYGHRVDHALDKGVGGTGDGKAVVLFQCGGVGNVASLERAYPDAQVLSTLPATTDSLDWVMWEHMIRGFRRGAGWREMHESAVGELARIWAGDEEYKDKDWSKHYFDPTSRSVLVERYDRDGDGTTDGTDHIFNVIYPKWTDAAGGYDPVVQPFPTYALDGTQLTRALKDLSLALDYNHPLDPATEATVPWSKDAFRPGGFFEAEPGDHSAFRFTRAADGTVSAALSTRFSHTQQEDLSRMLAYEAGLWLAGEAQLGGVERAALGVALLERVVHQQGSWYAPDGMLDEGWAEEALLKQRYGLEGLGFAGLEQLVGDPDEYGPEHFARVVDAVRGLPDASSLADRAPTRIGAPIDLPAEEIALATVARPDVEAALRALGIDGEVTSVTPRFLRKNQAENLVVLCRAGGRELQVALGLDPKHVVRAASTLGLDLRERTDGLALELLDQVIRTAADADAPALHARYRESRAAGRTIPEALGAILGELRAQVPPGTPPPRLVRLRELVGQGLLEPETVSAVDRSVTALYGPGGYGCSSSEKTLFEWVDGLATQHGLDPAALRQRYLAEVATGDGPAGRARGMAAVLSEIPAGAGPGEKRPMDLLGLLRWSDFVGEADRPALYASMRTALGVGRGEMAAESLARYLGEKATEVDPALWESVRADLARAVDGGAGTADALATAVERYIGATDATISGYGYFEHLGVFDGDEAARTACEARLGTYRDRRQAEQAVLGWAAKRSGVDGAEMRARYERALAAPGVDAQAALLAVVRDLAPLAAPAVSELRIMLKPAPKAERQRAAEELLAAAGTDRAAVARETYASAIADLNVDSAHASAALAAFDLSVEAGGGAAAASAALLDALRPTTLPPDRQLFNFPAHTLAKAQLLTGPESREVLAARGRLEGDAMLASALDGSPGLLEAHVARTRAGAAYGDSLLELLRAVPDDALAGALELPKMVQGVLSNAVEPSRRGTVMAELMRTTGRSAVDLAEDNIRYMNRELWQFAQYVGDDPATVRNGVVEAVRRALEEGGGWEAAVRDGYATLPSLAESSHAGLSLRGLLQISPFPLDVAGLLPTEERRAARLALELSEGGGHATAVRGMETILEHVGLGTEGALRDRIIGSRPSAAEATDALLDALGTGPYDTERLDPGVFSDLVPFVGGMAPAERGPRVEGLLRALGMGREALAAALVQSHSIDGRQERRNGGPSEADDIRPLFLGELARSGDVATAVEALDARSALFPPGHRGALAESLACWGLISEADAERLRG